MTLHRCDILVVGGGIAGVGAAISAARQGAETLLVESDNCLGGVGQAGMFRSLCGLYRNGDSTPEGPLNSGLTEELIARTGCSPKKVGRVWLQLLGNHDLHQLLADWCYDEPKLLIKSRHTARSVTIDNRLIRTVSIQGHASAETITPNVVIDCTGNSDLTALTGLPCDITSPHERQMAGFTVAFEGLVSPAGDLAIQVPFSCRKGVDEGTLPPLLGLTTYTPGESDSDGTCKMTMEGIASPEREQQARNHALLLHSYLTETLPPFRRSKIKSMSPRVLDREGRRICGHYQLTADDILSGRKFSDGVVRGAWPIELWESGRGPTYQYGLDNDFYEIPLRCLQVKGLSNLLCAGRCISATHEAVASTRVMGTCLALGEQAGRAAASIVSNGDGLTEGPR